MQGVQILGLGGGLRPSPARESPKTGIDVVSRLHLHLHLENSDIRNYCIAVNAEQAL
jgi:hypothetical protein